MSFFSHQQMLIEYENILLVGFQLHTSKTYKNSYIVLKKFYISIFKFVEIFLYGTLQNSVFLLFLQYIFRTFTLFPIRNNLISELINYTTLGKHVSISPFFTLQLTYTNSSCHLTSCIRMDNPRRGLKTTYILKTTACLQPLL